MRNGSTSSDPVPLLARVLNGVDQANLPDGATARAENNATTLQIAPAVSYVGESMFDGEPALIIDFHGMEDFSSFRDEMRYVGCGVWLGKTYLTSPPDTLLKSLAAVRLHKDEVNPC
jgi:hypothetical protein